jgi:hypothetical protein
MWDKAHLVVPVVTRWTRGTDTEWLGCPATPGGGWCRELPDQGIAAERGPQQAVPSGRQGSSTSWMAASSAVGAPPAAPASIAIDDASVSARTPWSGSTSRPTVPSPIPVS